MQTDGVSPTVSSWRAGLQQQWRVIDALVYRELRTRVGDVRFGFFGVIAEPLLSLAVFLLIFGLIRGRGSGGSLDVGLFLACGVTGIYTFMRIAAKGIEAMAANQALFFYRRVRPVDAVVSRAIVEFCLMAICFFIISVVVWILRERIILSSIGQIVAALLLLGLFSFGFSLFAMVAGFRYKSAKIVLKTIQRPLFIMSGVFFSLQNIPAQFRPYLSWNPILQAIELMRHGFNESYVIEGISMPYLALCSLLSCLVGLVVYQNNEPLLLRR